MPSVRAADLPEPLRRAADAVARGLAAGGHRCWIVGGAVRDLASGRVPTDVDVASAATPEEVEALFERTHAVGRAFGTLLVTIGGESVQHTTFRSESGYSDARHPDAVRYGTTLEEDAARRDFTCNALYLDPLTDEVRDPERGLADIERGRLRCVGDAGARFAEDGLRILRLARFAGVLGWEVEANTRTAASEHPEALSGLSAERVRNELERLFAEGDWRLGLGLLEDLGLLWAALPGLDPAPSAAARAWAVAGELPARASLGLVLAALYAAASEPREAFAALKPPRVLRDLVEGAWRARRATHALLEDEAERGLRRASRARLWRAPGGPEGVVLARAELAAAGRDPSACDALLAWGGARTAEDLRPALWLEAADLERGGVPRGAAWGRLLEALETEQLEGRVGSREEALRWLGRREDAS